MDRALETPQILLVEDDPNSAFLVTHSLSRNDYAVRHAASLAEGRREMAAAPYDLLLLDRRLPDGDGIELCQEVRTSNPHAYILILTGESSGEAKLAGFGCGADDYVTKPFVMDELLARVRAGLRIVDLQKALLTSNKQLEELSKTDALTGVRNRRSFEEELGQRFEHARRYNRPMSVVMIDVDHFKSINDRYGHPTGDTVLRCVAQVLEKTTRKSDTVARFGGEEFVVILPETPLFEALQFAEKIRASVVAEAERCAPDRVTISLGVAAVPHSRFPDAHSMVTAADDALYRAKHNGRNRVECERRRERVAGTVKPPQLSV